jgi:hypothetical protein
VGIRHNYQSGTANDPADEISSTRWNEDHAIDGPITLPSGAVPSAPSAGNLSLFVATRANRNLLGMIGPSGVDTFLQPALWGNRVATITPGRTTTLTSMGCTVQTGATLSHPTPGSASLADSIYRTRFQTSTTAGNAAGMRSDQLAARGNGTTLRGGFFYAARFMSGSIGLAGGQCIVGLQGGNGALAGEPSALTNSLFVGYDIADTNWQFMRNDGSGTCVKVDLGVAKATLNKTFDLRIYCPPGGSDVYVLVEDIANNGTATTLLNTSYSTEIPANTTFLAMHQQIRNGATAAAANTDMGRHYIESDF